MATDKREDLLTRLLAAHSANYDIIKNYRFEGHSFPGYAEFPFVMESSMCS